MNYKIRYEDPADYHQTEWVTREAFWNLYKPGCDEHFIVHVMRKHPDFIPELSFVIEVDGAIVGSIFYSKTHIIDKHEKTYSVISFGPVSILPTFHHKGLGQALITHSINEAKKMGHRAIIIGGYPHYYHRYGFAGTKKYGISMPDGQFYTGIMALPLYDQALDAIHGCIQFSDCFNVNEADVIEFDKNFPTLEKKILPCQADFEYAVRETE